MCRLPHFVLQPPTIPSQRSGDPRPVRLRRGLVALMLAGLIGLPSLAHGAVLRVGSGTDCDANTIQKAIDIAQSLPGTDTVQIANGFYSENLIVDGQISDDVINLIGRYDGCTDAKTGFTGIFGIYTVGPTILVENGAQVSVQDLQVTNIDGVALTVTSPNTAVDLANALVTLSSLGIRVLDGAAITIDSQSEVTNHHSESVGAGIVCFSSSGEPPQILVQGVVAGNSAVSGAGISASDGCDVVLAGARLWTNTVSNFGGAIFLDRGARLTTVPASQANDIRGNTAEFGGAIFVTDANTSLELDEADIYDNEATRGGGVFLQFDARAALGPQVAIFDNMATRDGGGIEANTNSVITLEDGVRIRDNSATDFGGGVYLETGASLHGSADGTRGIEISGNDADYGGGLYLRGNGTGAFLFNYHVKGNVARTAGGGAAVRFGAFLEMNRGNGIPCANPPRCSVLSENSLAFGNDGSALYLDTAASAKLYQTYIEHNRHQINAASSRVVQTRGDGTTLRLEGIQFWQNDATYLIGADGSSSVVAGFVSAARNAWTLSDSIELPVIGALTTDGGTVSLASSILVDTRGYAVDTSDAIVTECLIVDDATDLTINSTIAVGIDPGFHKPGIGDLHLRGDSPAIDYCYAELFTPEDPLDLDLDLRGVDHPDMPPGLGLFDLGIDETLISPPLFADGFESGDTSAWSSG